MPVILYNTNWWRNLDFYTWYNLSCTVLRGKCTLELNYINWSQMNKNDKIGAIVPCNWRSSFKEWDRNKQQLSRGNLSLCLYLFFWLYVFFLSLCLFPHLTITLFKASTSLLCNMNECINTMKILNNSTPSPSVRSYLYILLVYVHITPVTTKWKKECFKDNNYRELFEAPVIYHSMQTC